MKSYNTPEEAVQHIESGDRVFVHGSAATPHGLLRTLATRANELKNVEMTAVSTFLLELALCFGERSQLGKHAQWGIYSNLPERDFSLIQARHHSY
jgi:acyl-CoA hydrolase